MKIDVRPNARLSLFGRYGGRNLDTTDQAPIPLPSGGGGNGAIYAHNKQLALGATYTPTTPGRSSRRGSDGRLLRAARIYWRSALPARSTLYGLVGLPTDPRISGGLPSQSISGFAAFGRQATNPQWQYPTVWNPKLNYTWLAGRHSMKAGYEFQHIGVEVQDVNPLYGLDSYTGQFSHPAGASGNLYNLADFMFGYRSQYALSTLFVAHMRQNMHFAYLQDDLRLSRPPHAQPWRAL